MENLPFGPRTSCTPELVHFVTEEYGLAAIEKVEDIGGTYNLNVLLETPLTNFVLRVYRPWTTRERLSNLQVIKETLYTNLFPVVLPLRALNGQTILEYEGRLVEVEGYVPHQQIETDWQTYKKAFASMASFHDFLRENVDTSSFVPAPVSNYASPRVLLEWLENFEEVVQDQASFEVCSRTRQLLLKISQLYEEKIGSLPRQITHWDWRIGNILFKNGEVAAILDFDFLDVRERVFDLAYTLYWMFADLEHDSSTTDLAWTRVKEMLSAYNSASSYSLTKAEIEALPMELALVPLYWVGEAVIGPGLLSTLPDYARSVERAELVWEHADQLRQVFLH